MMKKILRVYDKAAEWLCKWGSDKYVHLLAGLLISYLYARMLVAVGVDGDCISFVFCGIGISGLVALLKEVADLMRGGVMDIYDIIFTMAGGFIGSLLFLIG